MLYMYLLTFMSYCYCLTLYPGEVQQFSPCIAGSCYVLRLIINVYTFAYTKKYIIEKHRCQHDYLISKKEREYSFILKN